MRPAKSISSNIIGSALIINPVMDAKQNNLTHVMPISMRDRRKFAVVTDRRANA